MHYLILRITLENGQYGHRILWRGSHNDCKREAWFTNIEDFRGPGIVKAELIVIDKDAWSKIKAVQVGRRG